MSRLSSDYVFNNFILQMFDLSQQSSRQVFQMKQLCQVKMSYPRVVVGGNRSRLWMSR